MLLIGQRRGAAANLDFGVILASNIDGNNHFTVELGLERMRKLPA